MDRRVLADLVAEGLTLAEMAIRVDRPPATVRRWLREHGLHPARSVLGDSVTSDGALLRRRQMLCATHGLTLFAERSDGQGWRCLLCRSQAVSRRRRKVKEILVAEAGGRCAVCGYDRHLGVLQFHHRHPKEKRFSLSEAGLARSLERAREEARKCVLLCANCHTELEAGVISIP
jgi:5-methylcytosine-specific restriction endonuclease McrA